MELHSRWPVLAGLAAFAVALFSLLLALTLGVSTAAATTRAIPYETVSQADPNKHLDTGVSAATGMCGHRSPGGAPAAGCYTFEGELCSSNPSETCVLAGVPANRCTKGAGACIWPQGSGFCDGTAAANEIACLSDNPADHTLTSGLFFSTVCSKAAGGTGMCNHSGNDPSCRCVSGPVSDPDYEGVVCGNVIQSVCSDGDPFRDVGGVPTGGALCEYFNSIGGREFVDG